MVGEFFSSREGGRQRRWRIPVRFGRRNGVTRGFNKSSRSCLLMGNGCKLQPAKKRTHKGTEDEARSGIPSSLNASSALSRPRHVSAFFAPHPSTFRRTLKGSGIWDVDYLGRNDDDDGLKEAARARATLKLLRGNFSAHLCNKINYA